MDTILEQLRHTNMEQQIRQMSGGSDGSEKAAAADASAASEDSASKPLTGVYRCRVCGYIFDEAAEGRSIDSLEQCPLCHVGREAFQQIR